MIDETLARAADELRASGIRTARLDAELLLQYALGISRSTLLTMDNRELSPAEEDVYFSLVERRRTREPLQYITGEAAFRHLVLQVTNDVLVPRQETEWVAEEVLDAIRHVNNPRVLDIGTGSGAIAISVAYESEQAEVVATDISRAALSVAIKNAKTYNVDGKIQFVLSDYFANLPIKMEKSFNVIVSNPPYIGAAELAGLEPEVRDYEPLVALTPGNDHLAPHRAIAAGAPRFLKPSGLLVLEIGAGTGEEGKAILNSSGFYKDVELILDFAGQDRVIKGRLK
jgi:release factor glutamine methyltransferase